jgi:hypothetical protein
MGIKTTVTLEHDVLERLKQEQRNRGVSFRELLNDLLRLALASKPVEMAREEFQVKPFSLGFRPGLNHDDVESLIEFGEGSDHR